MNVRAMAGYSYKMENYLRPFEPITRNKQMRLRSQDTFVKWLGLHSRLGAGIVNGNIGKAYAIHPIGAPGSTFRESGSSIANLPSLSRVA